MPKEEEDAIMKELEELEAGEALDKQLNDSKIKAALLKQKKEEEDQQAVKELQ